MGKAVAKAVIRADNRKLSGDLRKSQRMFGKAFKGIGRGIKGTLGTVLSPLGAAAGAIGFAAVGKEVLDFETTLTDLQIQSGATGDKMLEVRGVIDELSKSNATAKGELGALALAMVNLEGKSGLVPAKLKVLGDAAFATSTQVDELAGLSKVLGKSFGLIEADDVRLALDGIITAGKEGSIPLNEMNLLLQQNAALFSQFAKEGVLGSIDMAAAIQALGNETGTAGEAGTRLGAVLGNLSTRELELRKAGIEVKAIGGGFRELGDILKDIDASGILGDAKKRKAAFGTRKEVLLGLETLIRQEDEIKRIIGETKTLGTIERDAALRRKQDSFQIKKSFNDMKLTIMEAFTPERIRKFASAMEGLAKVIGFVADNATTIALMLASIKISSLVAGFSSMAATSGTAAANTTAMNGAMGKLGVAANLVGAALIGWNVGKMLDQWLGISKAISDIALPSAREEKFFGTANLRTQSEKVQKQRLAGLAQKTGVGLGTGLAGEFDPRQAATRSLRLAKEARRLGLVDESGAVNREKAFEAQTGSKAFGTPGSKQFEDILDSRGTAALVASIQQALAIEKTAKEAQAAGMAISITIDENGLLKAKQVENRNARRAPQ